MVFLWHVRLCGNAEERLSCVGLLEHARRIPWVLLLVGLPAELQEQAVASELGGILAGRIVGGADAAGGHDGLASAQGVVPVRVGVLRVQRRRRVLTVGHDAEGHRDEVLRNDQPSLGLCGLGVRYAMVDVRAAVDGCLDHRPELCLHRRKLRHIEHDGVLPTRYRKSCRLGCGRSSRCSRAHAGRCGCRCRCPFDRSYSQRTALAPRCRGQ
mmetsp:Transcript_42038/g.121455  ORF Transcript_42038/g.121455 Transcript_42038/m.121455 type:complete len:212 (+) Transcript_42038:705-1340(+)